MKVIVPYANDVSDPAVHYCVDLNLQLLEIDALWVRMHEPNDYSILINRLWDEGEKFVLIEHDVIVWRGAVEQVWECDKPFCGFDGMLCCAKLDPTVLGPCPVNPKTTWTMMDGEIHRGLWARDIGFHDHIHTSAPIINLNRHNMRK